MKLRWAALAVVLALGSILPSRADAQSQATPPPPAESAGKLGQNFPNPFNPETTIPFALGDPPACTDPSARYRVSLRIYNVLAQLVAVPVMMGGGPDVAGRKLENLELTCGEFTAFWNGKYLDTNQDVASGVYLYRLEVNGRATVRKMIVMK
jgi:hypothetical protein